MWAASSPNLFRTALTQHFPNVLAKENLAPQDQGLLPMFHEIVFMVSFCTRHMPNNSQSQSTFAANPSKDMLKI